MLSDGLFLSNGQNMLHITDLIKSLTAWELENYCFNYRLWCKKPSATFVLFVVLLVVVVVVVVVVLLLLLCPSINPMQWQGPLVGMLVSIWLDPRHLLGRRHIMYVFGNPVHPSLLWSSMCHSVSRRKAVHTTEFLPLRITCPYHRSRP